MQIKIWTTTNTFKKSDNDKVLTNTFKKGDNEFFSSCCAKQTSVDFLLLSYIGL